MAAPSFGASATPVVNSTAGTSVVFDTGLPTRTEDDLLIVVISRAVSADTITAPTGFRLLNNNPVSAGDLAVFAKVITASEPSSYTFDGFGSSKNIGQMFTVTGADPTNTFAAEPTANDTNQGTSANPDPPASGTVASGDYLALAIAFAEAKNASWIEPSGYTEREDDTTSGSGPASGHTTQSVATLELTGVTAEDPGTFTTSNSDWAAMTYLIAEPAGGGVNVDGDGIGHAVSQALTVHDVIVISDGIGHASPSALTAHDVIVNATAAGHAASSSTAIAVVDSSVTITATAIGRAASSGVAASDVVVISDATGHAAPSALTAHDVVVIGSGVGHAAASGLAESPQPFEVSLGPIDDPGDDSNHELQVRMRVASGAGTMVVQLKQGNTIIQEFSQALTTSFVEYAFDVTSASSITNYNALRVRGWIETGNTGKPEISRIRLCMPSVPAGAPVVAGTGIGHVAAAAQAASDLLIPAVAVGHGVSSGQATGVVVRNATAIGRTGVFGSSLGVPTRILTAIGRAAFSGEVVGVPTRILTGVGHAASSATADSDVLIPTVAVGHGVAHSTVVTEIVGAVLADATGHATPSATADSDLLIPTTGIGRTGVFGSSLGVPVKISTATGRAVSSATAQADVIVNGTGVGHAAPSAQAVPGIIKVATAQGHAVPSGVAASDVLVIASAVGHGVPSGQAVGALGEFVQATASGHATARGASVTDMVVVATASDTAAPSAQAVSTSLIVGTANGHAVPSALSVGLVSQLITASAIGHATPQGQVTQPVIVVVGTATGQAAPSAQAQLVRIVVGQALGQMVAAAGSDSDVLIKALALGHAISWGQVSPEGETILLTAIGRAVGWAKAVELTQVITGVIGGLRDPEDNVSRTKEMNNRSPAGITRGVAKRVRTPETTTRDPDTL